MSSYPVGRNLIANISQNEFLRLRKKCKTDVAMAKKLKTTTTAIRHLRQAFNVPALYAGNPKRNSRLDELTFLEKDKKEIAKKFGLSISSVYRILRQRKTKKLNWLKNL